MAEKEAATEEMRNEFSKIAVQIASKILEREVSANDNKELIDEFFTQVESP